MKITKKITKRVLIAEDEKAYSRALSLKLKEADFHITNAGDGEEALKLLQSEDFDLIILDLIMPKLDGFTVLEKMNELGIKIPVIVLTNLSQEEDKAKIKSLGCNNFMEKSSCTLQDIVELFQTKFSNKIVTDSKD